MDIPKHLMKICKLLDVKYLKNYKSIYLFHTKFVLKTFRIKHLNQPKNPRNMFWKSSRCSQKFRKHYRNDAINPNNDDPSSVEENLAQYKANCVHSSVGSDEQIAPEDNPYKLLGCSGILSCTEYQVYEVVIVNHLRQSRGERR